MKALILLLALLAAPVGAQTAKQVFGAIRAPNEARAQSFGTYNKGCLAGAAALPETGAGWQAMRLSRNRTYGHPDLIAFIQRLGAAAQEAGWPRLYVGDLSQPRGGPMLTGHRSHQIGLDADIWLTRPVSGLLSRAQREKLGATNLVARNRRAVSDAWTPSHAEIIRAAARQPQVARIFVNAAIKRELCRWEGPARRDWLRKIRPWWGHDHHFHVRLACPAGSPGCREQSPPPPGDGCGDAMEWWFSDEALGLVKPKPPSKPRKPKPPLTLADLPPACAAIVRAP